MCDINESLNSIPWLDIIRNETFDSLPITMSSIITDTWSFLGCKKRINNFSNSVLTPFLKSLRKTLRWWGKHLPKFSGKEDSHKITINDVEMTQKDVQKAYATAQDDYYSALYQSHKKKHHQKRLELSRNPYKAMKNICGGNRKCVPRLSTPGSKGTFATSDLDKAEILNQTFATYCALPSSFKADEETSLQDRISATSRPTTS